MAADPFLAAVLDAFLAVDFFAVAEDVAFLAAPAAADGAATTSLGSFLAPETTFFRSWPGVNFGTFFFLVRMVAPVCGLRAWPALRTLRSKEPNPVIATFSPRATSRVMVSSTESSACAACLRLPSNRADSLSMS